MDYSSYDRTLATVSMILIAVSCFLGFFFSITSFLTVRKVRLNASKVSDTFTPSLEPNSPSGIEEYDNSDDVEAVYAQSELFKIYSIYEKIRNGAFSYMKTEILFFIPFLLLIDSLLLLFIGLNKSFVIGVLSATCFMIGATTSLLCGAVGMAIATYSNARTTVCAQKGLKPAFVTAFTAAQCFGFFLPSMGILVVFALTELLKLYFKDNIAATYSVFASFGLGGSIAGLTARVSGGIFTKAADVGADMVGKTEENINEDDPRNPAVIADNVGDNVGDIAGMGADLFGSFGEATCSSLIILSNSATLSRFKTPLLFPILYLSISLVIGIVTSFFATRFMSPTHKERIESTLKFQILIFSTFMIFASLFLCLIFLPSTFNVAKEGAEERITSNINAFYCVITGILGGAIVGVITEYYTSNAYSPVRQLAQSSDTGPATVIIFGLSLGYRSTFLPVIVLAIMMFTAFFLAEFFGVVLMALGLLAFTPVILTIDAYGPICDNAGGIAEMAGLGESVRERTDALDAAGNTTAAIGKGFAICLAYIVGMALLTSFVRLMGIESVNILSAFPLFGMALGASYPFIFAADLNQSVGYAAAAMVEEVRRQFRNSDIINGEGEPDYEECIRVATRASLNKMVFPFLLTLTPIVIGFLLGDKSLAGFIFGVQVAGVPLAVASNNSGGAWDNAKKYIESGALGEGKGKNSENHYASVIGDTVGDPMKDTSGPSINTLLKVVAIISVVLSPVFPKESLIERLVS